MASDWKEVPIGSLCEAIYDGPHATPRKTGTGPVFLGISSLVGGRLDLSQSEHLSEADFVRWTKRVLPRNGDLVFSYETRLGEAALIPKGLKCCLGRRMALMRLKPGTADPHFLLYAFLSPKFQGVIRSRTKHGSTVQRILLTEFPEFPIFVPDLQKQRKVGQVLAALDERISFLEQSSRTLEAIAQAIFKSWFVDFDPVRAKAEGREPEGMDAATAALFPSQFQNSLLGPIPHGWNLGTINDLADVIGGSTPSTKNETYWEDLGYAWATPKDLSNLTTPVLLSTERALSSEGLKRLSSGLLPVGTVLMSSRAPIGYIAIAEVATAINQGFIAMRPRGRVSNLFLLFWTQGSMDLIRSRANGSTFQEISKASFRPLPAIIPALEVMALFDGIARPLYNRMVINSKQVRTLASIRDTLLPKLISGQIRVPEADAILEKAL